MPRSFTKRSNAGLAIAAAGVLLLQAGRGWAQTQKPSSLTTLTSAQQVRVLSPDEANRGYPVHIRAVVTYCDPAQQDFFVQDGTAGIYIDDPGLKTAFAPGDLLEIDGISEDLDFAPQIGKPHYKSLGHAALPEPRPASFDALMSTREDSQFVQFEGVVRNATLLANRITLDVVGGGGHLSATILNPETLTPARLVDAKVRLRGVCGGIYNQKKQLTGVQLAVPGAAQVSVLDRPPLDPFRLPVRPLSNLMIFTPQGDTEHRIRVQGTVTLQRPKGLFIQSGAQGLFIPGPQGATLTPGQRLDVVGFADIGDYTPVLQHPLIRPIGSAPLPGAISVGAKDVLARALDATRVSLEGTLREERRSETDQELVLDDGGVLFETRIDRSKVRKGWPGLPPGSRVRVTGVCSVTADRDRVPTGFDILLDSPSELAVLARPSWWTLRNTLASLALLAVITLGVLAWVGVLRRQVHLSRERAQILFSANPHPAYVLDLETLDFLEVNDAAVEHYGYSREEFLGMKATVLQPDDDQETFRERLRRLQSSRGIAAQRRHRTKDGHLINVEVSFQTIDFGGRKASLTIAQDVTERIRAEAENMRLAAAIQQSVEAIIITDAAGTIQFVNPAFSQITGYSAGEALGQNPRILKSGKQDPALYEDLWSTILGGRTWRGEIVNRRKNGTLYSEEMTITPVRDVSGTVTNFVAIKQDLTHHKRAAEALTASEKRYRQLFERNAAGVFATTLDGRILNCNQAAAEMFGYHSPSEVPHLRVVDLHSSSDPRPVLERLRLEKSLTNCELQLMRSDGTPVWAIGNLNLVEGGNGQPGIVETILVDITERKRAEEALRQNEQSFHLLFSDNPLPMWVYDVRNLRFLEVNTAAVAHYGYSRDEFLGMRIADIRPEDDLPLLDHSLHMERPDLEESGPWRHRLRDGRIIDVQIISHPMMWHGVSAVLVVAQDVTDRKRAEEALRQSEARYRLLFERNLAGVFQAEAGGRLTDCNDACAHMLGYASREEMVNIPLGDLALDSEAALAASECLAEQKALTNFEIALKGQNGEPVWVIANVSVVQNCGTHYEGTVIDVTARKRAEEALRSRTVELERSNADLEQFAYVASHDLQEPLRMVANFTQLLRERYEGRLDQDADEFIGFAVEGATRMQNLIAGLLSYARVKSRARELESADSEAVLGRCLTTLRAAIRESEAQVTHDPLPAVLADDLQLEHVFQNLVSNALKFRGSDPPQVHISAERNGAQWVFSVKDNGIGIDPRFYERIFVIFQRLHTRQAYPGTGIGLSICKRIVERHGGRIWVESEEGKGATFYFTMSAVPEGDRRASGELLQLTA